VSERPDPRTRPPDPAGTRPKVDPESLLPEPAEATVEGEAVEEGYVPYVLEPPPTAHDEDLLPDVREPVGAMAAAGPVPEETKHTPRFQFLLGALLAIGAVALAAAVAIALRPSSQPAAPAAGWSQWQPSAGSPIHDIVNHVSNEYRLSNNRQLVVVTPAPLTFGGSGIPAQIALEQPLSQGGNVALLQGNAVVYSFCGLATKCALTGKPSTGRGTLLRREALEMALYTFRYIEPVDQVVVFLPPVADPKTKDSKLVALLFQRSDVSPLLVKPLYTTLARRTPSVAGADSSPDADLVKKLTIPYTPSVVQNPGDPSGSAILVLKPPGAADTGSSSAAGSSGGLADLSQQLQTP
jgi:hypothetical protein